MSQHTKTGHLSIDLDKRRSAKTHFYNFFVSNFTLFYLPILYTLAFSACANQTLTPLIYLIFRYLEIYNVDGDTFDSFKDSMNAPARGANGRPRPLAEVRGGDQWQGGYGPPQQNKPNYSSYPSGGG